MTKKPFDMTTIGDIRASLGYDVAQIFFAELAKRMKNHPRKKVKEVISRKEMNAIIQKIPNRG
jgi:hypothetical protein